MDFPTVTKKDKGIDYKDTWNADRLLQEINKPKQVFHAPTDQPPGQAAPGTTIDDPGIIFDMPARPTDESAEDARLRAEKARRTGKRTAVMVDQALRVVNGSLIAKAEDTKPYGASDGELQDLGDAWAEIAEEYDFNINPWLKLTVLNIGVYLPRTIKAFNDRRFNIMQDRIDELGQEIDQLKKQKTQMKEDAAQGQTDTP